MNITYIGSENECSVKMCNYLSEFHSVTLITDRKPRYEVECNVIVDKGCIDEYFEIKKTDVLIYTDIDENYSYLNKWLSVAKEFVDYILIVKEDDFFGRHTEFSCIERLLQKEYSSKANAKIIIINTSVLYGTITIPQRIEEIIKTIYQKNVIETPDEFSAVCDALHIEDFCGFIGEYLNCITEFEDNEIYVRSGYTFRAKDLFEKISMRYPQAENLYDENKMVEIQNNNATHLDEWTSAHSFLDDFDEIFDYYEEKTISTVKKKSIVTLRIAEKNVLFLLMFVIIEFYTNFMSVASELQFVDMRLVFIAVSAIIMGEKYALSAALLCSISSILHTMVSGIRWHVIFFHVNNWIPIAVYIVFAIITGSYIDRLKQNYDTK